MAQIEGFRVRNDRALRDLTLGKLSADQKGDPLTPFTVVIGKNGVGKSTLFDAFGFVADCLNTDVEAACDDKLRGGFECMRSLGVEEPIRFDIYYRKAPGERPITYELAINIDSSGRPFVESEVLKQRRKGQKHGRVPQGKEGRAWRDTRKTAPAEPGSCWPMLCILAATLPFRKRVGLCPGR